MDRLNHQQFVILAMEKLKNNRYPGLHTVYSGFNEAFREYFPGDDPVVVTKKLEEEGVITIRMGKGGAVLYLKGTEPHKPSVLRKMGL